MLVFIEWITALAKVKINLPWQIDGWLSRLCGAGIVVITKLLIKFRKTTLSFSLTKTGGPGGNRTHVRGFAVRCITILPPDRCGVWALSLLTQFWSSHCVKDFQNASVPKEEVFRPPPPLGLRAALKLDARWHRKI